MDSVNKFPCNKLSIVTHVCPGIEYYMQQQFCISLCGHDKSETRYSVLFCSVTMVKHL